MLHPFPVHDPERHSRISRYPLPREKSLDVVTALIDKPAKALNQPLSKLLHNQPLTKCRSRCR